MKYQIRILSASALVVGLGVYLLTSGALQSILRPLWTMFSDYMTYLSA